MTMHSATEGSSEPLQQAGPVRRTIHLLVALAGWVLFTYWWWLVMRQTGRDQIVWTLTFIAISLAVIVLATVLWVVHNVRLSRRKGPRLKVGTRPAGERAGTRTPAPLPQRGDAGLTTSPLVRVVVEGGTKAYRASESSAGIGSLPAARKADAR